MDFDAIINNRRSARLFTNDVISNKQIERIDNPGNFMF